MNRCGHAVLLVGHGTRQASGTAEFFQFGEILSRQLRPKCVVRPCLLEFQSPTIEQAWRSLADLRPRRVTVAPLLLFAAGHAKSDIPEQLSEAARRFPLPEPPVVDYCPPMSRQTELVTAVRERLSETLRRGLHRGSGTEGLPRRADGTPHPSLEFESGSTAVIMVGRGSRDPCATSDMRVLSEVALFGNSGSNGSLAEQFGIAPDDVRVTFYAMAEPRLTETLAEVGGDGRYNRVVVYPHLLFSGRLDDAIRRQVAEAAGRFGGTAFEVCDYLGPTARVAAAIAARILSDRRRL